MSKRRSEQVAIELAAIDKVGRKALKRVLIHEVRCKRCGSPVYQLVKTSTPHLALRYRTVRNESDGSSLRHYMETGELIPSPALVRTLPGWEFCPVTPDYDDDDPDIPWMLSSACGCGQFYVRVRDILTAQGKHSAEFPSDATRGD